MLWAKRWSLSIPRCTSFRFVICSWDTHWRLRQFFMLWDSLGIYRGLGNPWQLPSNRSICSSKCSIPILLVCRLFWSRWNQVRRLGNPGPRFFVTDNSQLVLLDGLWGWYMVSRSSRRGRQRLRVCSSFWILAWCFLGRYNWLWIVVVLPDFPNLVQGWAMPLFDI